MSWQAEYDNIHYALPVHWNPLECSENCLSFWWKFLKTIWQAFQDCSYDLSTNSEHKVFLSSLSSGFCAKLVDWNRVRAICWNCAVWACTWWNSVNVLCIFSLSLTISDLLRFFCTLTEFCACKFTGLCACTLAGLCACTLAGLYACMLTRICACTLTSVCAFNANRTSCLHASRTLCLCADRTFRLLAARTLLQSSSVQNCSPTLRLLPILLPRHSYLPEKRKKKKLKGF